MSKNPRVNAIIMGGVVLIVSLVVHPLALVGLLLPILYYWGATR